MNAYERQCTCGDADCARTLIIESVYRVSIVDETDELAVAEIMTRDQLLDWVISDEESSIQNALNELSIEPDADDVRQWLDNVNDAADLRQQLAQARETIMALRLRLSLDNPAYRIAQPEPKLSAATGEGEGEGENDDRRGT